MGDNIGVSMEPLLDPEATAKFLNVSLSWLAKGRMTGVGPEFVRFGRLVRYRKSGLLKFINAQTRTSTAAE